ncbi:ThuA domain-containing protein [Croceicoccus ponticola]|uniref:ThuA domain-containing protein n=1 Tax=Croceicoccus ponticola TaxID=2217664 RepID=A0A437GWQ3_9SPHN|nr:ThuA domain-containing protein [Croceicoccus ponticola]RVQ66563.1 ThuA domain-containing protein [Croceicoccus ponticola]
MPTIDYRSPLRCLVAVRGHPFGRDAFAAVFEGMEGISATMVDQPAAALLMNPDGMRDFDVLVLYDMPGLDFDAPEHIPAYVPPPAGFAEGLRALLDSGKGIVALHHALAGWPTWEGYAEILGGRFLYKPGAVRGKHVLDSGFAHDVAQTFSVVGDHPVTAGLPATFDLVDEPYLAEVFEGDVEPLLRSNACFTADHFWSATHACEGRMYCRDDWAHPPGSNLAAWAKTVGDARLVYIQPGDGQGAYESPHYRKLVENAIRWVAQG